MREKRMDTNQRGSALLCKGVLTTDTLAMQGITKSKGRATFALKRVAGRLAARAVLDCVRKMELPGNIREPESWTMKATLQMTGPRLLASAPLGRRVGLRFCHLLAPPLRPSPLAASRPRVPARSRMPPPSPSKVEYECPTTQI